jgi:pyrroloquinoline quinone (PQQ) biosynthesis protein C
LNNLTVKHKIMQSSNADEIFLSFLDELYKEYLPSKHPFFSHLAKLPFEKLHSPILLGELYLRYQAACHATRVMVYHIPHLDSPRMRVRKLRIISDDDALQNGDTHHYQLSRVFAHLGAIQVIDDEDFGSLDKLQKIVDPSTASFLSLVETLYPKSLGPWCIIEMFADDWMRALMYSLSLCFPSIKEEPYFSDCFSQGVETRHAQEAAELTSIILKESPELLTATIAGAWEMASGLDMFWSGLEQLIHSC